MKTTTREQILNCSDFNQLLNAEYGERGTQTREQFEAEAEAFVLGEILRQERKSAGLTQQQLAEQSGYNKTTISRLEKGSSKVSLSSIFHIFAGMGRKVAISVLSLTLLLTLGMGQMWGAEKQRYIYCGISNEYDNNKDGSNWGFNFWGGTSGGVKTPTYIANWDHDGRTYHVYRVQVYDDNNKAQFKGNADWWDPGDGYSVTLNGTSNNAVFWSHSKDGWGGQFQENYQVSSTGSLSASSTSVAIGTNVTLTPSLTSNQTYNEIKSTTYNITTNPNSGGSMASNVFSATKAGTYVVTATITYNAKDFTGITKTVDVTKTITVYATVAFDKEGGSSGANSQNAIYGNTVSTVSTPSKDYYDFAGYWTGDDGTGTMVINASGVWQKNISNFTDNSSTAKWIILTNQTLHAKWTPKNYDISYLDKGGSSYSGSNSGSLPSSYTYGTGVALTDGVRSGYRFDGWFDNSTCTGDPVTSVSSSDHGDKTFYALWTENPGGTITLTAGTGGQVSKDGSSWGASKSYTGIKTTDALNIYAQASAGYTFSAWSKTSGSGTITNTGSASTTFTPVANADAALTASFTENKVTLTPTVSYDHGSSNYTASSSNTVGVATTTNLSCSNPNAAHYTFAGWTLTNLTVTSGNAATDRSITVKITTPGSPIAAVANYNEVLTTSWYIAGDGNGTGTDLTPGSPFAGWGTSGTRMSKKSGHSTEEVYYCTITVSTVATTDDHFPFKVYNSSGSQYYGNNGYWVTKENNHPTLSSTSGSNMKFRPYVTGTYEFKLDNTGANPVLTVTWPVFNQVRISAASPTDATNTGNFDMSDPVSNVRSVTRSLKANTTYTFKIMYNSDWYGYNSGTFTRSTSTSSNERTISTSGGDMTLTTDYADDYTFKFNQSTKALSVDFPAAYKITFGKGSVDGTTGSFSAVDLDNGSSAVTSNSTWVKSGHDVKITAPSAKSGYRFLGWYDNNSATGDAIETNANCTISVTAATTIYACYAENLTSITVSAGTGGTVTTGSGTSNLGVTTTKAINASANTGYSWSTWTTSGNAALGTTATTASNTAKGNGTNGGTGTITATFTPNNYDVVLDVNGATTGSDQTVTATFDAAMPTTQKGGSTPISAPSKTGYNFDGYTKNNNGTGTKYYTSALANNHVWDIATNNTHIYAKWDAKQSTLSFDYQTSATGYGTSGTVSAGSKATYDAAMPTLSGTMPTAANGYAFMGFYSATGGGGTKYYNADGTSANNWAENTESGTTLYAYYKKAEITALTFDAGTVEPEATVGVTPTISPTPVGTTIICWTILHSNDTPLDPQPEMTWSAGKLTFAASAYSGTYKVKAILRTGSDCGAGTDLDTETASFLVAGSHSVTVNYKCSSDVIKTATSVTGRPTDWSDDITAPDIFGYTFSSWSSADGVTIKDSEHEDVTSSTEATIKIKATYAGSLTANYTQNQMIFFKNTLGWDNVYVNFYTASDWDNTDNGSGYPKGCGNNGLTNRNKTMTQYGETDIWYYDYEYNGGGLSITPTAYISFTDQSQDGVNEFWASNPGINVVYPANYADAISTDKSSENGFKAATPMFVPIAAQDPVLVNVAGGGRANYYNAGYWSKYTPGTGYVLEVYNSAGNEKLKTIEFESADDLMPMKAVAQLEGGQTYKFQIRRGGESSAGVYYGNEGTMTYTNHGQDVAWDLTNTMSPSFKMAGITTNAAGDYKFNLSYSPYHNESTDVDEYRLRIAVDYPVADGDYRLVYSDAVQTKPLTSAIVNKVNDGTDIVSFFVRPGSTPVLRFQQATVNPSTGAVTWNEYPNSGTPTNQITGTIATALSSGGTDVYNFNLSMNGSGALSVASVVKYDGNYYIRTDAANSKWDNYRTDPDHRMTYSEYSITHGGYTHYYTHWVDKDVTGRKNVKFVIANDYSPNISDTLARETATGTWANIDKFIEEGGDLKRSANVRFMWDKRDNSISRAYVDGAQGDYSANFLYMLNVEDGDDKIKKGDGTALTDHKVTFKDNGNWMYEANIKAQPTAQIRLLSNWGTENTITQYFRGASDATETLLGGSGSTWYDIRIIYDFKSNRLIAGLIPSGTIDEQMAIHADVMFVREHHGDIAQLTFAEKDSKMGAITDIETAFGVLQFNKWTINNKSKETGHAPLSPLLSQFERDLFYVSFPFKVAMEEVFGFGTYGQHWIIEEYDGATRASKGYWAESGPNWKFVFNRKNKYFEPGQGYIIALDLDELGESSDVWSNTDQVELYFPSYGTMDNITSSTATYTIPSHLCTINRSNESNGHGGTLGPQYDRRVKDSHWNVLGVPTYVNPEAPNFANTAWTSSATETSIGPNFLYQWSMTDNTVSPVSASGYTYHAMHAYLVQYCGDVTWTSSVSVTPPSIVARRTYDEAPRSVEFRLELTQNDVAVDQTFVKLSDNEAVTTGFEFNFDLSKEFNKNRANIYTLIGTEQVAGNVLPLTDQTTVVPVGVSIPTAGDYTFSLPDGTEGIGVTLIDNQTGIRTRLSALDYTVNLTAGTHDGRFILEISPIHNATTEVELINGANGANDEIGARKVLIDGILYIVKGDKLYDVRGTMIK